MELMKASDLSALGFYTVWLRTTTMLQKAWRFALSVALPARPTIRPATNLCSSLEISRIGETTTAEARLLQE